MFSMSILASVIQSNRLPFAPPRAVADLVLVGHKGGHTIMTKIKSFTVGLPVTELKRAVDWYRQLLGEVEEVNPAPGVWEFQIVPSGWLQLFESEINEPNQSVMRFESHDIEASRMLASSLSINVAAATHAIEVVIRPERVYCALFAEETRSIHFHLFPRTAWLLSQYAAAHPADREISGPRLLDWARRTFHRPISTDYTETVQAILRELELTVWER
jgi:hypothetical protein